MKEYYSTDNLYHMHSNSKNIIAPNIQHTLHNHNKIELFYLREGSLTYTVECYNYELSQGDVIIINYNEFHELTINNSTIYDRCVLMFDEKFLSDFSKTVDFFKFLKDKKLGINNFIPSKKVKEDGLDYFFENLSNITNVNNENDLIIKCLLTQLLIKINNSFKDIKEDKNTNRTPHLEIIENVIKYIEENLTNKITLDELSQKLHFSKFYISHLFKENFGISLNEYIITKKILYANTLIKNGKSANEACYLSGFNNYPNFYRNFKKVLGVTPKNS